MTNSLSREILEESRTSSTSIPLLSFASRTAPVRVSLTLPFLPYRWNRLRSPSGAVLHRCSAVHIASLRYHGCPPAHQYGYRSMLSSFCHPYFSSSLSASSPCSDSFFYSCRIYSCFFLLDIFHPQTDDQPPVHCRQGCFIQAAYVFTQPFLIQSPYLFQ